MSEQDGDEGLQAKFKKWCRHDLETLSVAKATTFVNTELLSDFSADDITAYNLVYPVPP